MFDCLYGKIKQIHDSKIVLSVGGIGFAIFTPRPEILENDKEVEFFTYMHWNQETGPIIFGFPNELDRAVFLMIIDCPKVGPKLGLNILSTLSSAQFLDAVTTQNEKIISSVSGVGKKAEQIIAHLKHKVAKFISSSDEIMKVESNSNISELHTLSEALSSLGYSKTEISQAISYVSKNGIKQASFDQMLRSALSYFSGKI